ncbi:respiratory nitrate reductase 2 subunit beta [Salmonella enterica subsp. salamae]|nr:respiratory nitrate reductase 2 subunit beta [Salmonella enterica subsp. salamae]
MKGWNTHGSITSKLNRASAIPKNWEDQQEWQGGWVRDVNGKIRPRLGGKMGVISKIFANPVIPQIDDYYEPFTFDYQHLHNAPESKHQPTARPRSLIDGKRMDKVIWGPNWEELLGGEFEKRARDRNFDKIQKEMYGQFENTFMMYLPRLCEHCLNPSCVATCPSGAIYKREEDGNRANRPGQMPGLAFMYQRLPVQKNLL